MTKEIADCFPRRDSRLLVQDATRAMLMGSSGTAGGWPKRPATPGRTASSTSCPAAPGTTRRPGRRSPPAPRATSPHPRARGSWTRPGMTVLERPCRSRTPIFRHPGPHRPVSGRRPPRLRPVKTGRSQSAARTPRSASYSPAADGSGRAPTIAPNGGSARGYLGVGRASQQSRYGLLNGRLFCIFIHRHPWGDCPHLPLSARFPMAAEVSRWSGRARQPAHLRPGRYRSLPHRGSRPRVP